MKKVLNRIITRDLPLFMVRSSYGIELINQTRSDLGAPISHSYVLFERGSAVIYRDNREWYTLMPELLKNAINDTALKKIKQSINNTKKAILNLSNIKIESTKECLSELNDNILLGVPGMIYAHWVTVYHETGLLKISNEKLLYFRQSRLEIEKFFSLSAELSYNFIEATSYKHNVRKKYLKFLTTLELIDLLDNNLLDLDKIKLRLKNNLLFVENKIYSGNDIEEYLHNNNLSFENFEKNEKRIIQGTTANNGNVVGEVQIITSREDFDKFKTGNILVSPMTSPEYTSLIMKAKAVVTDEGGQLSHAAIVCRELDKPCIVGTKISSYALKNSQKIIVDATRGQVVILE